MNVRFRGVDDVVIEADKSKNIRVIEIVPEQIVTNEITIAPKLQDERIVSDTSQDVLKLVVVERHNATGNVGVGFVRGFRLKRGALGSTVAHDAQQRRGRRRR